MSVLVVDDSGTNRKLCRVILESGGYRVREASDGQDALDAVRAEPPDLIVMDVQMPVMNGVEVVARLRENPATRGIPVVAVTSYAMKGDREQFLEAGYTDYVSKPIDIDLFLEVVRRLTGPERAASPSRAATDREGGR